MSAELAKNKGHGSENQRAVVVVLLATALLMSITLDLMGRVWWCEVGDWYPWSFDIWSPHNSQHAFDPYALSHFQHGLGLIVLLGFLPQQWLSRNGRFILVAIVEAAWEVAENTPWIINRYREATVSLDYFGDSIANSISDYVMCMAGAWLASKTSWRLAAAVFVALEAISLIWIRDSLLLNILMLICPIDAIRQWQAVH